MNPNIFEQLVNIPTFIPTISSVHHDHETRYSYQTL